jgi:hypothetical protein
MVDFGYAGARHLTLVRADPVRTNPTCSIRNLAVSGFGQLQG